MWVAESESVLYFKCPLLEVSLCVLHLPHLWGDIYDGGCSEAGRVRHSQRGEETGEDAKAMTHTTQAPTIVRMNW